MEARKREFMSTRGVPSCLVSGIHEFFSDTYLKRKPRIGDRLQFGHFVTRDISTRSIGGSTSC